MRHDLPLTIRDPATGEHLISVADFVDHVRRRGEPKISKQEIVRRMEALGWTRSYERAWNPSNPTESVGVDVFRVPPDWF